MCFIPNGVVIDHQVRYSNKSLKKKQKTKNKKQKEFLSEYSYAQLGFKSSLLSRIYSTLSPFLSLIISSQNSLNTLELQHKTSETKMEQTFIMIKPDGVQRGLVCCLSFCI